jgi:hypothetical protein
MITNFARLRIARKLMLLAIAKKTYGKRLLDWSSSEVEGNAADCRM